MKGRGDNPPIGLDKQPDGEIQKTKKAFQVPSSKGKASVLQTGDQAVFQSEPIGVGIPADDFDAAVSRIGCRSCFDFLSGPVQKDGVTANSECPLDPFDIIILR